MQHLIELEEENGLKVKYLLKHMVLKWQILLKLFMISEEHILNQEMKINFKTWLCKMYKNVSFLVNSRNLDKHLTILQHK